MHTELIMECSNFSIEHRFFCGERNSNKRNWWLTEAGDYEHASQQQFSDSFVAPVAKAKKIDTRTVIFFTLHSRYIERYGFVLVFANFFPSLSCPNVQCAGEGVSWITRFVWNLITTNWEIFDVFRVHAYNANGKCTQSICKFMRV